MISKRIHRKKPTLPSNTLPYWRKWNNSWQQHEAPQPCIHSNISTHIETNVSFHRGPSRMHGLSRASFLGISLSLTTTFIALSQDKPSGEELYAQACAQCHGQGIARRACLKPHRRCLAIWFQPQCDFSKHQIRHLGFFDTRFRTGTLRCSNQSSH